MLVDTHILVWTLDGDDRIGRRAVELLNGRHPVRYSSISVLEIVIKRQKRGLSIPEHVCDLLDGEGFRQMPFVGEHAEALAELPELDGHDPFDRALMAQAKAEGLPFLTADKHLVGLGHPWVLDARL